MLNRDSSVNELSCCNFGLYVGGSNRGSGWCAIDAYIVQEHGIGLGELLVAVVPTLGYLCVI